YHGAAAGTHGEAGRHDARSEPSHRGVVFQRRGWQGDEGSVRSSSKVRVRTAMEGAAMPAVISPDQDAINAQVEINAPPERVFQALIDSAQARTWGSTEHFETTVWVLEPRIGGKWKFVAKDCGTGKVYTHYGEVLEFDPPRVLEHT